jgi:cytosine/adenosine deaminase-related metal-dependent hydrolase
MIVRVHAGWLVPIAAPVLRHGWMDVDTARGDIVGVGAAEAPSERHADRLLDLSEAVILPGLVNAHTHLELSHLAGQVPPADSFVAWVRAMLAVRFGTPAAPAAVIGAAREAIASMEATGTLGVGDIGNTDASVSPLAASSLWGVHFREALGLRPADASRLLEETRLAVRRTHHTLCAAGNTRLSPSCAPHAPYSTSPDLIRGLAGGYEPARAVSSIHLAESTDELVFLATGQGPLRDLAADRGAWDGTWPTPGVGPVAYLAQLGVLHPGLLVVHGTQLRREELQMLASTGATLVLCARSNRWVGAGVPPVSEVFASGGAIAIGTDSLASVADLNLFAELQALRDLAPDVPARSLLRAATLGGARALGCDALGVLAPGATSRAVVRVPPPAVTDVEEWLVAEASDTSDLRWLDDLL